MSSNPAFLVTRPFSLLVALISLSCLTPWIHSAEPVKPLDPETWLNGQAMQDLVRKQFDAIRPSVVEIIDLSPAPSSESSSLTSDISKRYHRHRPATSRGSSHRVVGLGTVVSSSGWILTKGSELPEIFRVRLADGSEVDPAEVKRSTQNDLALFRTEPSTAPWTPVHFGASSTDPALGSWVGAYSPNEQTFRLGLISANPRPIARVGGYMGIILGREQNEGVLVSEVVPNGGAKAAGIQTGDLISHVEGKRMETRAQLIETVTQNDPGKTLTVTIVREGESQDLSVMLGHRALLFDLFNRNQSMSGLSSKRRTGFDRILQHDISLRYNSVGGPLLDLDGNVVGFNIARANRVEFFALPASVVQITLNEVFSNELGQSRE